MQVLNASRVGPEVALLGGPVGFGLKYGGVFSFFAKKLVVGEDPFTLSAL